jgi:glutathione S-transferase
MDLTLYIGNKAYSSWSARPWLLLQALQIPFTEKIIPLYVEGSRDKALAVAPTGKVPVLIANGFAVWDSLAIVEFLAEAYPADGVWPEAREKRGRARSLCAEMHAGFQGLRQACPTNFRRAPRATPPDLDALAQADLARIDAIFAAADGPFLFGEFGAADAFFTPVASRIETYALPLSPKARATCQNLLAHPAFAAWRKGAPEEKGVIEKWENL